MFVNPKEGDDLESLHTIINKQYKVYGAKHILIITTILPIIEEQVETYAKLYRRGALIPCPKAFIISQLANQHKSMLAALAYLEEMCAGKVKILHKLLKTEHNSPISFGSLNMLLQKRKLDFLYLRTMNTTLLHVDPDFEIQNGDIVTCAETKDASYKKLLGAFQGKGAVSKANETLVQNTQEEEVILGETKQLSVETKPAVEIRLNLPKPKMGQ